MENQVTIKGLSIIELEERHEMAAAPGFQVAPNYPGGSSSSDQANLQLDCCCNRCNGRCPAYDPVKKYQLR